MALLLHLKARICLESSLFRALLCSSLAAPLPIRTQGGAIAGVLSVSATDCTFTTSTAATRGGALISTQGGVTVASSTFTAMTAAAGDGGAIWALGNVSAAGSTFSGCAASGSGGAIASQASVAVTAGSSFLGASSQTGGGAIVAQARADVSDSTFDSTTTKALKGTLPRHEPPPLLCEPLRMRSDRPDSISLRHAGPRRRRACHDGVC